MSAAYGGVALGRQADQIGRIASRDGISSLPALFFTQAAAYAPDPFLWWRRGRGSWQALTWQEAARQVRAVAAGLKALGVGAGSRVLLLSENRPEWVIADLAIMSLGAAPVPALVTGTPDDLSYIVDHSQACGVLVSNWGLAKGIISAAQASPLCRFLVGIEPLEKEETSEKEEMAASWPSFLPAGDMAVMTWAQLITTVADSGAQEQELSTGMLACLLYTSGSSARPKGVMLSHGNILANVWSCLELVTQAWEHDKGRAARESGRGRREAEGGGLRFLSFLPLGHAFEHTAGLFLPIALGAEIAFAGPPEGLSDDFMSFRPNFMLGVPRLLEALARRLERRLKEASWLVRLVTARCLALGLRRQDRRLSLPMRAVDNILTLLVRRKIQQSLGGALLGILSGGAALSPRLGRWLVALGVPVYQGYGLSEASPVVSVNRPLRTRVETAGPPLPGVGVTIAEDGEIIVTGAAVMQGYWRDSEATAAAMIDGRLHTGDLGRLDDGFLIITDRKKDMIVLVGGENISPAHVEALLETQEEIAQAVVTSVEGRRIQALLVPAASDLALSDAVALRTCLQTAVTRANRALSLPERIHHFAVVAEPFSLENGLLTPTLKKRRRRILTHYQELLHVTKVPR